MPITRPPLFARCHRSVQRTDGRYQRRAIAENGARIAMIKFFLDTDQNRNFAIAASLTKRYNTFMLTFNIEQTDSQCIVTWRHTKGSLFFMFIWLAIWSVGCGFSIHLVFVKKEGLFVFLAALLLWTLWFVGLAVIINMLFGKTLFILDENGFDKVWTCLSFKRVKHFDLADIRRFETKANKDWDSGKTNFSLEVALHVGYADFNIYFYAEKEDLNNLCRQLNGFLKTLKTVDATEEVEVEAGVPAQWEVPVPMVFAYNSQLKNIKEPLECRWEYRAEVFNGFSFRLRNQGTIPAFIGMFFFAAFWNGILTPFLLVLFGIVKVNPPVGWGMWWILFFFLIPFTFIGLLLFYGVIEAFLELFRRTTWRFAYGEAVFRTARLGPARIIRYDLTAWHSLVVRVVRDEEEEKSKGDDELETFYEEGDYWQLAFLDKSDADLAVIEKLRKPEALWLADVILRERRAIR